MIVVPVGMTPQSGKESFSASQSLLFPKTLTEKAISDIVHIKIILVPDLTHIVLNYVTFADV